jgi:cysteine synthase A
MELTNSFAGSLDHTLLNHYTPLQTYLKNLGDTPLIEVPGPAQGARIFAKCEWENPTGTVKDRPVFGMIYNLLRKTPRELHKDLHILEYTGGSLGMALSRLCAELELNLTLVLSASTDPGIVKLLRSHGTDVVLVPKELGFWGVMEKTKVLAVEHPTWSFLYQHENPANLWMHKETTGREIARQLPKDAPLERAAWVASIGTGGSLMGVAESLWERIPHLEVYATTPAELPYGSELAPNGLPKFLGSGGLGSGRRQTFVAAREARVSGHLHYSYDESLRAMKDFHAKTGIKIGSSAAANWLAACEVATRLGSSGSVIFVVPSAAPAHEWLKVEALN